VATYYVAEGGTATDQAKENATDMALGWVDLGSAVSQQDGDVTISWDASGIFTVTVS